MSNARLNLDVPAAFRERVEQLASDHNCSMRDTILQALDVYDKIMSAEIADADIILRAADKPDRMITFVDSFIARQAAKRKTCE